MQSSSRAAVALCCSIIWSGCGHSCSCESSAPSTGGNVPASVTQANAGGAPGSPPTAAPKPVPRSVVDEATAQKIFPDLPSESDRAQLSSLADKLRHATPPDTKAPVATRERLMPVLPQRIGGFMAKGAVLDGPSKAGADPIRVLSRTYLSADRQLYVKVSDTLHASALREAPLEQLGQIGGFSSGFLHGRLLAGYPATAQYYPRAKNAQVVVLLGNRYLLEVRLAPAESAEEAILLAQRLPLTGLAPPEPAADALHVDTARATASDK